MHLLGESLSHTFAKLEHVTYKITLSRMFVTAFQCFLYFISSGASLQNVRVFRLGASDLGFMQLLKVEIEGGGRFFCLTLWKLQTDTLLQLLSTHFTVILGSAIAASKDIS